MLDAALLRRMTDRYVRDCFRAETAPRVSELADCLGLSPVQLARTFDELLGVRPSDYLKRQQVEFAKELLATTNLNTTQIAYRAGFGTRATFFRLFRKVAHTTPRKSQRT